MAGGLGALGGPAGGLGALASPRNTGISGGVDRGGPQALPGAEPLGGAVGALQSVAGSALGGGAAAPGGDRAAQAKAAQAAGYKDIGNTDALKTGNYTDKLTGFNTGGWGTGERGSGTLKNKFGQIASRFDPSQPGAAKAMMADEDFRAYWPDATIVEHPNQDLIDFDGPGGDDPVDVIKGAMSGGAGEAWAWQPTGGAGGGAGASAGGQSANGLMNGGDPMGDINAQIEALMNGQDGEEQNLIQQMLRGEGI